MCSIVVFQGVSHGFSIWFFHGSGLQLVIYGLAIALLVLIFVIPSPLIDPKGEGMLSTSSRDARWQLGRKPLGSLEKSSTNGG
jgi:hypothetical protein